MTTMRAMVFYGPGDLRDEQVPVPEPAEGEVVLRIDAALTCGTDVKTLRRGHPVMIPRVPTVFGHEFAGRVAAVGAGVRAVREGDHVVAANSAPCRRCALCLAGRPNLCEDLLFVNGAYGEFHRAARPASAVTSCRWIRPPRAARRLRRAAGLRAGRRRAAAVEAVNGGRLRHGPLAAAGPGRRRPRPRIPVGNALRLRRVRSSSSRGARPRDRRHRSDCWRHCGAGRRAYHLRHRRRGLGTAIDAVGRGVDVVFCWMRARTTVNSKRAGALRIGALGRSSHPDLIRRSWSCRSNPSILRPSSRSAGSRGVREALG